MPAPYAHRQGFAIVLLVVAELSGNLQSAAEEHPHIHLEDFSKPEPNMTAIMIGAGTPTLKINVSDSFSVSDDASVYVKQVRRP
jgi:hypothetical protein